jgi:hypothetical protein
MIGNFKIGGLDAHPTKGFRQMARPRKANSRGRRALIPVGFFPLSRAYHLRELKWDPKVANWSKVRKQHASRNVTSEPQGLSDKDLSLIA